MKLHGLKQKKKKDSVEDPTFVVESISKDGARPPFPRRLRPQPEFFFESIIQSF